MVEDYKNEASSFFPAKDYLKMLYATICQESTKKTLTIDQYLRCKNPTSSNLVKKHSYKSEDLLSHNNNDKYMAFLYQLNHKINSANIKDNLTLFYIALLIWDEWLVSKTDKAVLYRKAIIYNFVLLVCKNALSTLKHKTKTGDLACSLNDLSDTAMIDYALISIADCEESRQEISKMVQAYDDICNEIHDFKSIDLNVYFQNDLPIIHRISVK